VVGGGGFEPPKAVPADLQSAPFDQLRYPPKRDPTRPDLRRTGSSRDSTSLAPLGCGWPPPPTRGRAGRPARPCGLGQALVAAKALATSAMASRSCWPTAGSVVFFASPAFFVAFQKRSWRSGTLARCSGLK
jgi:hypothetical protein